MSIGAICNRDVVIVDKNDSIVEAAHRMREHHVGALVVVEHREGLAAPVGVVTDRDIVVEIIGENVPLGSVKVSDVMSLDLLTARENDGIWETVQRMRLKGVRRVPVVNDKGGLVGIVAVDDLLDLLADELSGLAKIVGREQSVEKVRRV